MNKCRAEISEIVGMHHISFLLSVILLPLLCMPITWTICSILLVFTRVARDTISFLGMSICTYFNISEIQGASFFDI